ncbi:MBL fold metallo-hydrolase [Aquimarina mytili]|uniref:MBL fold metallo-hydrolase n=1 Tax=Aquimarina mytili TaxID=874423 RepID=A0A937D4Z3_9FLAO|nr:MBL fold metallo-hydrolase [Aquimarina mytili]MBL0682734.1 MBL fold metallo-hydrolase [Aquimarina mytili]
MSLRKQFGSKVTAEHENRYAKSTHWDGKKFENLEETKMDISFQTIPKLLYKQFCERKGREPDKPLDILPFDKEKFLATSEKTKFIWYGHSVVLIRMNNKTILIDPMLGPNAAPISPMPVKRFSENTIEIIDNLPNIDLLLLSHDHYDHLDYESIKRLESKVSQYYVALGTARHLEKWGVAPSKIQEFDWWDNVDYNDIKITFTPTRHFSGRGLTDRAKSLWGGWALKTSSENILFSGDSGYGNHFKTIGKTLGPFDFAIMECGQYNENWHQIHMYPEESVQAAIDIHAHLITAVHWAGFALAQHHWTDPIERFISEAKKQKKKYILPKLGEIFTTDHNPKQEHWWSK